MNSIHPFEEGALILDAVHEFLGRFIAYPSSHAQIAHTLWIAHAHLMDEWESTPRIAFLSPEPASGKTRALEITELLVPRPIMAVNVSPAYLFRKVADDAGRPTLLYDEIDTVFGPSAKENEEIRGLLNAGHRKGALAGRCVIRGKQIATEEIEAYCAVAVAGLRDLPDTILTRAVVIKMRRRAPNEIVEPYRRRVNAADGEWLNGRLARWAEYAREAVTDSWPEMPQGIQDRDADVWEPLLAVADAAGGDWPEKARVTAVTLVTLAQERSPSMGVQLLSDIRSVFGPGENISTESLLNKLYEIDESPWQDIRGKPLNERGLAARLRHYDIKPKVVRISPTATARGYARDDFYVAWNSYLPAAVAATSVTPVTSVTELRADPFESLRDGSYGLQPSEDELELPEFLDRRGAE